MFNKKTKALISYSGRLARIEFDKAVKAEWEKQKKENEKHKGS
jgi:hypothetical protein